MTWPNVVFAALVVGALLYAWHQVRPLLEKRTAAVERKLNAEADAVAPKPPVALTPREALPANVRLMAEQWRDPWAREQAMDYYCQVYDQTQDWRQVEQMAMAHQADYLKQPPA